LTIPDRSREFGDPHGHAAQAANKRIRAAYIVPRAATIHQGAVIKTDGKP